MDPSPVSSLDIPVSFGLAALPAVASVSTPEIIINVIVIIALIVASALMSASEVAFFSLSPADKDQLKQEQTSTSNAILELLDKPKELLATILILNNLVIVGTVILSSMLLDRLIPGGENFFRTLIEVVGITFILLLFGEVSPKIYANTYSLATSRLMARPLLLLNNFPPFSWLRIGLVSGTSLLHKFRKRKKIKISSDDLQQALALTKEENSSEGEQRILEGIVRFGNTEVRQIMCGRMDMVGISAECTMDQVLGTILEAGYSRIPVFEGSLDNVIGILYIKDLLPHLNNESFAWTALIRKPYFIPENKKIDDLLKEFQGMKMHMAIVIDEYGGANGLVTLEDILEEIVGDITDEFDDDEIVYTRIDDKTYLFEGKTLLVDFYKVLDVEGKEIEAAKGESDTLSGFVIEQAGRILKNNEYVRFGGFKFIVESSDKRRIKMIKAIHEEK